MHRHRVRSSLLTAALLLLAGTAWFFLAPPPLGGSTSYVVTHGVSMEPKFKTGDLALVRPAADYRVGDVVAYHSSLLHIVVLHRIYAIHDGHYTFKGDNNNFLDPVHPTRSALVGKLWVHLPHAGVFLTALHNPITAAVLIGVIGLVLLSATSSKTGRGKRPRRPGPPSSAAPPIMTDSKLPGGRAIDRSAGLICAGGIGLVAVVLLGLALLAFARPTRTPRTHAIPYTQSATFSYGATVRTGPVYPSGKVSTGDPIFLALVHRLNVGFAYRFSGPDTTSLRGTVAVLLKLTGPTGWSRTISLAPARHFHGDRVSAHVSLNLSSLQAMLSQIALETGISTSGYTAAVAPEVHVRGLMSGRPLVTTFTPSVDFGLEPLQLQPGGGAAGSAAAGFAPSQRGSVATSSLAESDLTLPGFSVAISTLRVLAPIGFLIALGIGSILMVVVLRSPVLHEAARIKAKYGHMMVSITAGHDLGWPAIDVASIKALARLAESSGQLILHSHDDSVDTYMVNDEGSVYRYQARQPKVVWGEWSEPTTQLADAADLSAAGRTLGDVAARVTEGSERD